MRNFLVGLCFITYLGFGQSFEYVENAPFGINVGVGPDSSDLAIRYIFRDFDEDMDPDLLLIGFNWDDSLSNPINFSDMIFFMDFQENIGTVYNPQFQIRETFDDDFNFPGGYSFYYPDVGDLNGDGKYDFVVSAEADSQYFQHGLFYMQIEQGDYDISRFDDWELLEFSPFSMFFPKIIDLDMDGDPDILMSGFYGEISQEGEQVANPKFLYAKNTGSHTNPEFLGWFTQPYGLELDTFPVMLNAGDLDNDSDIDLLGLGVNGNLTTLQYYENRPGDDGYPAFNGYEVSPFGLPEMTPDQPFYFPSIIDIDGDGDLDIFLPVNANTIFRLDYYENTLCERDVSTITETICEGESYFIGEQEFSEPGEYTVRQVHESGCISYTTLTLDVIPDELTELNASICEGDSYVFGDDEYSESGTYELSLISQSGCDSTVRLDLAVYPTYNEMDKVEICEGESYQWEGNEYTESILVQNEFLTVDGCDSLRELDLTVYPVSIKELDETICEGDSVLVGEESFSSSGNYEVWLSNQFGCDSIIYLDLRVEPEYEQNLSESICQGDTLHLGEQSFYDSGTYMINLLTTAGCDSLINLELNVIEPDTAVVLDGSVLSVADYSEETEYQWIDCQTGEPVEGANGEYFDVPYSGLFALLVSQDGCELVSSCYDVIATGYSQLHSTSLFTIYPNPVRDQLHILNESGVENVGFKLMDKNAKTIRLGQLTGDQNLLDVSDLTNGVYLLKFKFKDREVVQQFVVLR